MRTRTCHIKKVGLMIEVNPIRRCGREGEGDGSGSVTETGSVTDGPQGDGYCKLQAKRCKGEEGGRKQQAAWSGAPMVCCSTQSKGVATDVHCRHGYARVATLWQLLLPRMCNFSMHVHLTCFRPRPPSQCSAA